MTDRLDWFKSSYSDSSGGDCVEVAVDWRKSTHSNSEGGACVEVAPVHVRDSKDPDGPHLCFTPEAWSAFLTHTTTQA
jgi:hypothetical protein